MAIRDGGPAAARYEVQNFKQTNEKRPWDGTYQFDSSSRKCRARRPTAKREEGLAALIGAIG